MHPDSIKKCTYKLQPQKYFHLNFESKICGNEKQKVLLNKRTYFSCIIYKTTKKAHNTEKPVNDTILSLAVTSEMKVVHTSNLFLWYNNVTINVNGRPWRDYVTAIMNSFVMNVPSHVACMLNDNMYRNCFM